MIPGEASEVTFMLGILKESFDEPGAIDTAAQEVSTASMRGILTASLVVTVASLGAE